MLSQAQVHFTLFSEEIIYTVYTSHTCKYRIKVMFTKKQTNCVRDIPVHVGYRMCVMIKVAIMLLSWPPVRKFQTFTVD